MKRSPMKRGRKPVKRRNGPRARARYARNFGDEAEAVRAMPCLVTGTTPSEPAHVVSRGAGGGRFDIIPLSPAMHAQQHSVGVESFAAAHRLDLRAEADRVALSHEAPLGVRGLAKRWAKWWDASVARAHGAFEAMPVLLAVEALAAMPSMPEPLDDYEREALLGWVSRRMEATTAQPVGLAAAIAETLGIAIGAADALCELAGWPS